jgi:hypothetical protein
MGVFHQLPVTSDVTLRMRRMFTVIVVLAVTLGSSFASMLIGAEPAFAAPPTETTVTSSGSPSALGAPVTLTATVIRPGNGADPTHGTVTFFDWFTEIGSAELDSSHQASVTTSALELGGHLITAVFAGTPAYEPSWGFMWQDVRSPTTTTVASSPNPSQYGELVTLTANVSSSEGTPDGTVAFLDGGTPIPGCDARPLAAGSATCTTPDLSIGSHSITAAYAGTGTYPSSTSGAVDHVVNPLATEVALSSDLAPSTYGDLVMFTAVVSAPAGAAPTSGNVTFYDGAEVLGTSPLDSSAVATFALDSLAAGNHSITAVFDGDATHAGSTSPVLDQLVLRAGTTTTVTYVSNPSPFGEVVTFTAIVTPAPAAGTVQFSIDGADYGAPVAVGAGGVALSDPVLDLAVGDHTIQGAFSGSANFEPSTGTLTQTVVRAATTTALTSNADPSVYGDPVTFTATVSSAGGTPSGTVEFRRDGTTIAGCGSEALVAGVATCTVSSLGAGTHSVTAHYSGSDSFVDSSSAAYDQEVLRAATSTILESNDNPSIYRDPVTFTATVLGVGGAVPTGTVQFEIDGVPYGAPVPLAAGSAAIDAPELPAGNYQIVATYSGNDDYEPSDASVTQIVVRAATATVIESDANPSVFGDAVTFTATVTPHPAAGTVQFRVDGIDLGTPVPVGPGGVAVSESTTDLDAGDHEITADFSGSANFLASSGSLTQDVGDAVTSTSLDVTPANPAYGAPITATATVGGAPGTGTPNGSVQFAINGVDSGAPVSLTGGVASTTMSGPSAGHHMISARYLGSSNHRPSEADQAVTVAASGYWMISRQGSVYAFGDVPYLGGVNSGDAVDIEPTKSGQGYWTLGRNGVLTQFGDAPDFGDAFGGLVNGEQAVSISATPSNDGYWIFTDIGRALAFGAAPHLGDMSHIRLNGPVLGSISTPTGQGYYMVASDGGVFSFGDAQFYGSMGSTRLNAPVMGLVPDVDNVGYWLVARDGGVFAFDAPFLGSMGSIPLNKPVIGMVGFGQGYLMVAEDGGIFNFSELPFRGSLGSNPPPSPIVAVASWAKP